LEKDNSSFLKVSFFNVDPNQSSNIWRWFICLHGETDTNIQDYLTTIIVEIKIMENKVESLFKCWPC